MGSTAFLLMIITLLSKLTGLFREQVFAYYMGTGIYTDVYSTASTIPFTIFGFLTAGVVASFIPIYNKIESEKGRDKAELFTSNLVNILILLASVFILLIYIFAPQLVKIIVLGYSGDKLAMTIKFTRILSFTLYIAVISSVFIAYLNIKGNFVTPSTVGIIMNGLHVIILIVAFKINNFFFIAYGFLAADYLKYMFFPKNLRKANYKHKFIVNFKDENILLMLTMSLPIILSIAAVDLSTIVDQNIASLLYQNSHGAVASLKFANLILQLISGVIVVSVATVMYPKLSEYANKMSYGKLKKTMMDGIIYAQIFVVPATIGVMVLAEPTIKILFERGSFDANSTMLTSSILYYYLPSLIGLGVKDLVVRGFYAKRDMKTPVYVTVFQMILNIVLNIILSSIFGLKGLALATSISAIASGFIILYIFRKKYGQIQLKRFYINMTKVLFSSFVMGVFTYLIYNKLQDKNYILAFLLSILVSAFIYFIVLVKMRIPAVKQLINKIYYSKIHK